MFASANSADDGEMFVKTCGDSWVVGKKSDQREFYVVVNQKTANLIEINGEPFSFFFRGPIRSDDQPPVLHVAPIISIQRDPVSPSWFAPCFQTSIWWCYCCMTSLVFHVFASHSLSPGSHTSPARTHHLWWCVRRRGRLYEEKIPSLKQPFWLCCNRRLVPDRDTWTAMKIWNPPPTGTIPVLNTALIQSLLQVTFYYNFRDLFYFRICVFTGNVHADCTIHSSGFNYYH